VRRLGLKEPEIRVKGEQSTWWVLEQSRAENVKFEIEGRDVVLYVMLKATANSSRAAKLVSRT
jgi:hypothetical protein